MKAEILHFNHSGLKSTVVVYTDKTTKICVFVQIILGRTVH